MVLLVKHKCGIIGFILGIVFVVLFGLLIVLCCSYANFVESMESTKGMKRFVQLVLTSPIFSIAFGVVGLFFAKITQKICYKIFSGLYYYKPKKKDLANIIIFYLVSYFGILALVYIIFTIYYNLYF